jgi:hypothetical protein
MPGNTGIERIRREKFRTLNQSETGFPDDKMKVTALAADGAVALGCLDLGRRLDLKPDPSAVTAAEMLRHQNSGKPETG